MAWGWISGSSTGTSSNGAVASLAASYAAAVTSGHLLVVRPSALTTTGAGVTFTVSDNAGNTYNNAGHFTFDAGGGNFVTLDVWYATASSNATPQVTVTPSSSSFLSFGLDEYSFVFGYAVDGPGASSSGSSATADTGSIPISGNNLIVGLAETHNVGGNSFTAGSGYTARYNIAFSGGVNVGYMAEDALNITSAQDATWTLTSAPWRCAAVAFSETTPGLPLQPWCPPPPVIPRPARTGWVVSPAQPDSLQPSGIQSFPGIARAKLRGDTWITTPGIPTAIFGPATGIPAWPDRALAAARAARYDVSMWQNPKPVQFRFRQGDIAQVNWSPSLPPPQAPVAIIVGPNGPVAIVPLISTDGGQTWHQSLQIGASFPVGLYTVIVQMPLEDVQVVPGGDPQGDIVAMYWTKNANGWQLITQLRSGKVISGRNPRST